MHDVLEDLAKIAKNLCVIGGPIMGYCTACGGWRMIIR
jgi:hypothetical protein